MLDAILVMFSLWWFMNTKYFESWENVMIGGNQFSISLTALIVFIYLGIGVFGFVKWYYTHKRGY